MQTIKSINSKNFIKHQYSNNLIGQYLDLDNRYLVKSKLGEGSFGTVYKIKDTLSNQYLTAKLFYNDILKKTVFRNQKNILYEANILKELNHNNIVKLTNTNIDKENNFYILMEYIDGLNLKEWLKKHSFINISIVNQIMSFMIDIVNALDYIHKKNIIHRDIKPENVLISNNRAILVDFGISKIENLNQIESYIHENYILITKNYSSPEQKKGLKYATKQSDIFSLGVIFYESLTKIVPKVESNYTPLPPSNFLQFKIPKDLDKLILNMLFFEPQNRLNCKAILKVLKNIKSQM